MGQSLDTLRAVTLPEPQGPVSLCVALQSNGPDQQKSPVITSAVLLQMTAAMSCLGDTATRKLCLDLLWSVVGSSEVSRHLFVSPQKAAHHRAFYNGELPKSSSIMMRQKIFLVCFSDNFLM